jgi:hypothetical protein
LVAHGLRDVLPGPFGGGEHHMAFLSFLFAERKRLGIELPLVMERPFSSLDNHYRSQRGRFLQQSPCQVILLVNTTEVAMGDGFAPDWRLEPHRDDSRITRARA